MGQGTLSTSRAKTGGRPPTNLTPAIVKRICDKVECGVPQQTAAMAAGVPKRTLQGWLERGRRPDAKEPYKSFAEKLEFALSVYHESRVVLVQEAAKNDPKIATWELERRFRDDWGDPRRGDVNVNVTNVMASDEWRELLHRVTEVLRERHPDALRTLQEEFGSAPAGPRAIEPAAAA